MRKIALTASVLAVALTGVAQADDSTTTTPDATATAQQLCRAERGTTTATRTAFAQKYGTNKNKKNAFGKCVSKTASTQAHQEDAARTDASSACRTEQGTTPESETAFDDKYGTNKNKKNAFGKCVSQKASEQTEQEDATEVKAAKACSTERGTTKASQDAFTQKYGTNKNKKNAFGKCVSKTASAEDKA